MTPQQQFEAGMTHHRAGRLAEAEKIYRHVLAAQPKNADVLFLLGSLAHQSGKFDAAFDLLNQAIVINPNAPDYHLNLGVVLMAQGRLPDAIAEFRKTVTLQPQHAAGYYNLGLALAQTGQLEVAANALRQAATLNPNSTDVHNNLGSVLGRLNRLPEAEAAFRKSVALQPQNASALNNLGLALQKLGRLDEALAAFNQAAKLKPDYAEYLNNLGMTLGDTGHLEEALATFRQVIALNPNHAQYFYHMGIALEDLNRPQDALAAYQQAITLNPNHPESHMSTGIVRLLLGDLATGWKEYEWRAKCPQIPMQRNIPQPQWTGDDPNGKTILLHWEQGLGDTIQFIRYAPLIAARGATVLLKCQPELEILMKTVDGITAIATDEKNLPPFQFHCPLASLPLAFGTTLETIPAKIPYVTAPPDRIKAWRNRLDPADSRIRVGLSWAGQPKHRNDRRRSMRLEQFSPLAEVKSARFFSLQKGMAATQSSAPPPGMDFVDWTPDLHNFAETAALITNLDLIICVDTSVAHLAGAMGKPVWLLLPFVPDWRWMENRTDSPWYPTLKSFASPPREIGPA